MTRSIVVLVLYYNLDFIPYSKINCAAAFISLYGVSLLGSSHISLRYILRFMQAVY